VCGQESHYDLGEIRTEGYLAGRRRRKKNGRDPGKQKDAPEKSKAPPKIYVCCLKSRTNHNLNPKFSNNEFAIAN
jgi:hypothetical protein